MSNVRHQSRSGKESIHSGHFMVSHFEAEAQDEFDDLAVPVPEEEQTVQRASVVTTYPLPGAPAPLARTDKLDNIHHQQLLSIETSLTKLFKCMTLAYRQKLTSPKWNRFKGIKLRWKDKIRLNNVIWRCWHMQFIKKQNTLVCQFASPLDVDTHVKPETTILEGKYWKRRAEAVIAEYKKWRMFHIMRLLGKGDSSVQDTISDMEMDTVESLSQCSELAASMLADEDYLGFMSDTLFSTITSNQPFAFPDPREIARGASLADFIQPSLGPLQPNLDDFMDTLEPLHDILSPRLAPVPEESAVPAEEAMYRGGGGGGGHQFTYSQSYLNTPSTSHHGNPSTSTMMSSMQDQAIKREHHMQMYDSSRMYSGGELSSSVVQQEAPATYSQAMVAEPVAGTSYGGKSARLQYVAATKAHAQQDTAATYAKYNTVAVIPPSQTAPETVSLLQQPVQNMKYTSTIVAARGGAGGAGGGRRALHPHYPAPAHYAPAYPPSTAAHPHYLQPAHPAHPAHPDPYKGKQPLALPNPRTFKMPSPPLTPAAQQAPSRVINPPSKDTFRSSSLPIGAQLNADWSITPDTDTSRNTARQREPSSAGAIRVRSRSSSGGGEGGRRPPPLHSVASDPALPQASVMLAQLLSVQQSQNVYKFTSSTEEGGGGGGRESKSPSRMAQISPAASDIISPHHSCVGSASPGASPPLSPGAGAGAGERRLPPHTHTHMHAEQKRRYNIKNGFDTLQQLIPQLNANPSAKISKAAMLQKGAEYIKQLKAERNQIKEEMESLRQQIECLNNSIANCHSLLPAEGAPVSRARSGRLREKFARHVANRTMHNWKYWLFSVVAGALLESFGAGVSVGSRQDLVRSTLLWAEQHCSLVEMRPAVLSALRALCTSTDILTSPERLPDEARAQAAAARAANVKPEPS